jgi:hypothetical protein
MYFWQMLLVNPTVFTVAVRTASLWTEKEISAPIATFETATTWIRAAKLASLAMAKAQVMKRTGAAKGVATL